MKMGNQDRERPQRIKVTFSRAYRLKYAGCGVLDRCFTHPMLPWVVAEIKQKGQKDADTILLEVTHTSLRAIGCSRSGSISGFEELLFEHRFNTICKVAHYSHDRACFTYLIRECAEAPFTCHVFQATDEATVLELFATMREMTKGTGGTFLTTNGSYSTNTGSIASVPLIARMTGSVDSYSTNSQQFELLYVGKIKVSHKRAPPSFIDEAVDRFKQHEKEMILVQQTQQQKQTQQIEIQQTSQSHGVTLADPNLSPVKQGGSAGFNSVRGSRHRHGSGTSVSSLPYGALEELVNIKENELSQYNTTTAAVEVDKHRKGKVKSHGDLPNSDLPDLHEGVLVPENIDEGISSTESSGTDLSLSNTMTHPLVQPPQPAAINTGTTLQGSPGTKGVILPEISVPSNNSSLENITSTGIHSLVTHTQSMDASARESLMRDLHKCASQEEPSGGSVLISPGSPSSVQRLAVPSSVIGTELSSNDSGFVTHSQSLDITGRESLLRDLRSSAMKQPSGNSNGSVDNVGENSAGVDRLTALNQRVRSASGDILPNRPSKQTSLPPYRTRVSSGGHMDLKRRSGMESNSGSNDGHSSSHQQLSRAMLLLIGKLDLCLIGTDMKQVMLRKTFSDISHCCKGVKQSDHFGFICREVSLTQTEAYVGYVFRCQTKQVVDEIMQSLKQAFNSAHQAYQRQQQLAQRGGTAQGTSAAQMLCEACPMHWFHRLCVDLEGLPPDKVQLMILRRMKTLTDAEREDVMIKYQGAESDKVQEQNEIFMMLLRAQCEHKQLRHTHKHHTTTSSNRTSKHPPLHSQESLSNIFSSISHGKADSFSGTKGGGSTFDNLKQKARQSLSNSFDSILKKRSKEDLREKPETPTSTTAPNKGRLSKNNSTESTDDSPKQQQNGLRAETSSLSLERTCVRETSLDPSHLSQITSELADELDAAGPHRPRSSTFSGVAETEKPCKMRSKVNGQNSEGTKSPIMSIFMKVGNQNKSSCSTASNGSLSNGSSPKSKDANAGSAPSQSLPTTPAIEKSGPWRQTIFQRVQAPNPATILLNRQNGASTSNGSTRTVDNASSAKPQEPVLSKPRSPGELRRMWKKAIMEQILLIRMEKENRKLQQNQDAASHKRMRLDYQEVTPCLKEAAQRWEQLLRDYDNNNDCCCPESQGEESGWKFDDRGNSSAVLDPFLLIQAVKNGVPRSRRGDIWKFLANQQRLRQEKRQLGPWEYFDCSVPYDYGSSKMGTSTDEAGHALDIDCDYGEFLKQLTPHQHAILIDLGRTFPSHPFFAQPLGAGQLSLFNLLKAYSLLDPLVGYCQGLSFVAGVLLLHMSEEEAFHLMRHVLFRLGIRKQYKPDMVALQIQMYQLSRLIHDIHHDVHEHFEEYDIAPTLYAAPWFLTLFASQFPLGFVARLFDLIFVQGLEAVFKVALVLVGQNKERLLACHSFEAAMDFLKTSLPNMGIIQMERLFNQVFTLDISRQLHSYRVEYQVLQEEMLSGRFLQNAHQTLSTQTSLHSDASLQGGVDKKKFERLQQKLQAQEEATRKLEQAKKDLERKNYEVHDQLESSQGRNISLENQISSYQSTVKRLETRIRDLEEEREALLHSVNLLRKRLESGDEPDRRRSGVLLTTGAPPQPPKPEPQPPPPQAPTPTAPPKNKVVEDDDDDDDDDGEDEQEEVRGRTPSLGALKVVTEGANIREELSIAVRKLSEQLSQQQEARLAEERKQAEIEYEKRIRNSRLTEGEVLDSSSCIESQSDKSFSTANGMTKGSIDVIDHPLKPA